MPEYGLPTLSNVKIGGLPEILDSYQQPLSMYMKNPYKQASSKVDLN